MAVRNTQAHDTETSTETSDTEPVAVEPDEAMKQNYEAEKARDEAAASGTVRAPRKQKSPLSDLVDVDLIDPETGQNMPLSATTDNLQATVVNYGGRALLKVAVKGYIGEEPVTIRAEDAGEFAVLIEALEKAAVAQKKDIGKRSK